MKKLKENYKYMLLWFVLTLGIFYIANYVNNSRYIDFYETGAVITSSYPLGDKGVAYVLTTPSNEDVIVNARSYKKLHSVNETVTIWTNGELAYISKPGYPDYCILIMAIFVSALFVFIYKVTIVDA